MDNKVIEILDRLDGETGRRWYYKPERNGNHSFICHSKNNVPFGAGLLSLDDGEKLERFISDAKIKSKEL